MFKIDKDTIYLTRGDKAEIELSIDNYTFQINDTIEFRIYNKSKLNEKPIFEKKFIVNSNTDTVILTLLPSETKLGDLENKPIEYWYEIELNDEQTIIGYDEKGGKKLKLYPEGAENDD